MLSRCVRKRTCAADQQAGHGQHHGMPTQSSPQCCTARRCCRPCLCRPSAASHPGRRCLAARLQSQQHAAAAAAAELRRRRRRCWLAAGLWRHSRSAAGPARRDIAAPAAPAAPAASSWWGRCGEGGNAGREYVKRFRAAATPRKTPISAVRPPSLFMQRRRNACVSWGAIVLLNASNCGPAIV